MKKIHFQIFAIVALSLVLLVGFNRCSKLDVNSVSDEFSFVFLTDIHVQPERRADEGFRQAVKVVNELNPDFVITGGDLIMDALGQSWERSDSLYNLYREISADFTMPVYNTIGNHEIYGIYEKSGADTSHPEYGEKMFEKRLGPSYYAFEHKGWKFFILNSIEDTRKSRYIGLIDDAQIDWIKKELAKTDSATPLVISTHIPIFTIFMQKYYGTTKANDSSLVVANGKEVIDLFAGHNLRLVLQGHLHTIEDIYVDGVHFLTGGAVSARWWTGPNHGYEEGFMMIRVKDDDFDWEYIDYGWEVEISE
ncbi:MAG: metallophosphoesterase [Bacteroidetes bacterium]|nr:metallophosphoesterase [Bacteroidota bacterium]